MCKKYWGSQCNLMRHDRRLSIWSKWWVTVGHSANSLWTTLSPLTARMRYMLVTAASVRALHKTFCTVYFIISCLSPCLPPLSLLLAPVDHTPAVKQHPRFRRELSVSHAVSKDSMEIENIMHFKFLCKTSISRHPRKCSFITEYWSTGPIIGSYKKGIKMTRCL